MTRRGQRPPQSPRAATRAGDAPAQERESAARTEPGLDHAGLSVVVLPGFNTPRANVWIRNGEDHEIIALAVTQVPRSGSPVSLVVPSPLLMPGEACVITLPEAAQGEVVVTGLRAVGAGRELTVTASIPGADRA